ncbi:hypothetical protein [Nonomuraea antimicrobica]
MPLVVPEVSVVGQVSVLPGVPATLPVMLMVSGVSMRSNPGIGGAWKMTW